MNARPSAAAVIAAAGAGRRMGGGTAKQFLPLDGVPILALTLQVFEATEAVGEVVVVAAPGDVARCRGLAIEHGCTKVRAVVPGGSERQESVYQGLLATHPSLPLVAVHDAARPLITAAWLGDLLQTAAASPEIGLVPALPLRDTIKRVDAASFILATLDRSTLWATQTPQVFARAVLLAAHEAARATGVVATDDAALVERWGGQVKVVPGWTENIKVTVPEDLVVARAILEGRRQQG